MELTTAALFIRSLTVATHRKNILRKIQACSLIKLISLSNRSRCQTDLVVKPISLAVEKKVDLKNTYLISYLSPAGTGFSNRY